jgi:hypothetical protein
MYDKKIVSIASPDMTKLKAVIIDGRTTIYIDKDADPGDAKRLYEERRQALNIKIK